MIIIDAKNSVEFVQKYLLGFEKQIPFVARDAINNTAFDIKEALEKNIEDVFDRPTPWTMKSVYLRKADKHNLEAIVWLKRREVKGISGGLPSHLTAQVFGGQREYKPFEMALYSAGILKSGLEVTPGGAAPIDRYGNMTSGIIRQMMNYFNARRNPGYMAGYNFGMTAEEKEKMRQGSKLKKDGTKKKTHKDGMEFFIIGGKNQLTTASRHKLKPGIWMRVFTAKGPVIHPVMMFVKKGNYRKRFDFFGIADQVAEAVFERNFAAAAREAIRTAK